MASYKISEVTARTGLSADTLRYYEKIGLLPHVARTPSGVRRYDDKDLSRLAFIKRAQRMSFSLQEIRDLLSMREGPQQARDEVRQLTAEKLAQIEENLRELGTLKDELTLLLNLCRGAEDGCPIIEDLEGKAVGAED
ncbi:MAG TPA: heavy metal-responsive transcriptional regulator [Gammaproteobacteria bacterium]|nr:heavy metal-responsive transcriptional regulator [Gammaproteobacteria bacterium]